MHVPAPTAHRHRRELPRGTLARLGLLFFIAHPGSAATFGDTRTFLLSRYPNRDLTVPSSLRRRTGKEQSESGYIAFIRPSTGVAHPPSTTYRGRPHPVIIGNFIADLERKDGRTSPLRRLLHRLPNLWSRRRQRVSEESSQPPQENAQILLPCLLEPLTPEEATLLPPQSADFLSFNQATAVASATSQERMREDDIATEVKSGIVESLLKKSGGVMYGAVDGLVSFVEAKVLLTELAMLNVIGAGQVGWEKVGKGLVRDSFGGGSAMERGMLGRTYDLVGFTDADPIAAAKKAFKRSSGLHKLLL